MKNIVLALDAGKFALKALGRDINGTVEDIKKITFRSLMYNTSKGYIEPEGNSFKIELDGETFIVGDQGETGSDETSKTSLLHKLCAYTAICQYIEPNTKDNHINIVLACPVSVLKNEEAKEEYKNFIKSQGIINVNVNDENYEFTIDDITIKAEGSGIVYLEPDYFKNSKVGIVDFGGLNMGFALFENGVAVPSSRFTEELGSSKLEIDLVDILNTLKKGKRKITEEDAAKALRDGFLTIQEKPDLESTQAIEDCITDFINAAFSKIKKRGFDLDTMKVVFVGGTTKTISKQIRNSLEHAYIPSNPQLATVEGLYKVAIAKYSKKL